LRGKLHAKTGTLNGAIALSGFLDAAPGHTLAFALVTNGNPSGSHKQVRAAHEQLISILADYAQASAAADPKSATPPATTPGPWGNDPPPPASQSTDDDEDSDPDAEPAAIPGPPL
jgi:hypothetical protein